MKTTHLSIIIITIVLAAYFLNYAVSLSDRYREACGTTMMVIYAEPAKYNQTVLLNALKDNLSKDDFRDYHGPDPWWQSVVFNTINKHAVNIMIPSVDGKTINMTKTIISKIDGVEKILSSETQCTRAE